MKKRTKKQHTVPQFYLKGFATSAGKLFAYDKKNDRVYATNVGDAAQEAFFYDLPAEAFPNREIDVQAIEKALSVFESGYSPLLAQLIAEADAGQFSHELISETAPYVVLQWKRTKTYRDTAYEMMNKMGQNLADDLLDVNFPGAKETVRVTMGKEHMPILHAQEMLDEEKILKMARALESHFWVVGINCTAHPFYTSDHPVARRANVKGDGMVGALARGVEFVFPLDRSHVLLIMERRHFADWRPLDNRSVELTGTQVDDYNRLQVMRSSQRLFCEIDDFELARRMCEEHPAVRDPDRPRVKVESTPIKDLRNYVFATALE
jgi:hypothetical protein